MGLAKHLLAVGVISIGFGPALAAAAVGPLTTDSFDQSKGGSIVAILTSPTLPGFDAIAAIGGGNGGGEDGQDTIFSDSNGTGTNILTFTRTLATPLYGISLYVRSDPAQVVPSGDRSTGTFSLQSGTLVGTVFTPIATLVNNAVPNNSGTGSTYTFTPTTALAFQATFNTGFQDTTKKGERVIEIDAVDTPEPASLCLLGLSGLGVLARRRRIATHQARSRLHPSRGSAGVSSSS